MDPGAAGEERCHAGVPVAGLELTGKASSGAAVGKPEERCEVRWGAGAGREHVSGWRFVSVSVGRRGGSVVACVPVHTHMIAPNGRPG